MTTIKVKAAVVLMAVGMAACPTGACPMGASGGAASPQARVSAGSADPIPAEKFQAFHALIKPKADELRWREIPWLTSLQQAVTKAAAENKPILLFEAADGHPLGRL